MSVHVIFKRKEETKNQLLLAAASVFAEKGYMDCTVKEITTKANLSVGSFYSYFSSKEEALTAIYDKILELSLSIAHSSFSKTKDSVAKRFTKVLSGTVYAYISHEELSKILFTRTMGIRKVFENKRLEILQTTTDSMKELLFSLLEQGCGNIKDLDVTAILIANSLFGVITCWLSKQVTCSLEEMVFFLCSYHLTAIGIPYTEEEIFSSIREQFQ